MPKKQIMKKTNSSKSVSSSRKESKSITEAELEQHHHEIDNLWSAIREIREKLVQITLLSRQDVFDHINLEIQRVVSNEMGDSARAQGEYLADAICAILNRGGPFRDALVRTLFEEVTVRLVPNDGDDNYEFANTSRKSLMTRLAALEDSLKREEIQVRHTDDQGWQADRED